MARARAIKPEFRFTKGLITEASPLDYPEGAFEDGSNVDLSVTGEVQRRLGVNGETSFSLSTNSVLDSLIKDYAIDVQVWKEVAENAATNFSVVQIGPTLYFYDLAADPISGAAKSFTVDLTAFKAPAAASVSAVEVTMDSGQGKLFVTSSVIEPFFITYDPDLDTISTTQITMELRDFDGVDDTLAIDNQPASLSTLHEYNLKNQGWVLASAGSSDPITVYQAAQTVYPANNQQWWVGKNSTDVFTPSLLDLQFFGNTPAPKGHYILNLFSKDRDTASGLSGIPTETEATRPSVVSFYAGRVFYAFKNTVYFSQVLELDANVGKCYQVADPTSEQISDLLSTDGGVIPIPEAGDIKSMFQIGSGLVVFSNDAIHFISGVDGNFRADDFSVNKIPGPGAISQKSIVNVNGLPTWWTNEGIFAMQLDSVSGLPQATNLTDTTIKTLYDAIPAEGKSNATGVYDKANKLIRWLFSTDSTAQPDNPYKYDSYLVLNATLGVFYDGTITDVDAGTYPLVAGQFAPTDLTNSTTKSKLLILKDISGSVKWSFGEFNSTKFVDFKDFDVLSAGESYSSYIVTGPQINQDISRNKQTPYIHCFFRRSETAFELSGSDYIFDRPSSCNMQVQWEWSDSSAANRQSALQQVYRFRRTYFVDPLDLTFDPGFELVITKNKFRGHGKTYKLRFESEAGKDFQLLGWSAIIEGNQNI